MPTYIPKQFQGQDPGTVLDVVSKHPFATLVSSLDGEAWVSHLPLVLDASSAAPTLIGHLAAANPHVRALTKSPKVTAIFHGPHAYVSPRWYVGEGVPTWNYVVVHAQGECSLVQSDPELRSLLKAMSSHFDPAWEMTIPSDLGEGLSRAIVGLRIPVSSWDGKFKLSQNRTAEDWAAVRSELSAGDSEARSVSEWMGRLGRGV